MGLAKWLVAAVMGQLLLTQPAQAESQTTTVEVVKEPASGSTPAAKTGVKTPVKDAEKGAPNQTAKPVESAITATPSESSANLRLRALEERVNELKEKIFQSKARLIQLQEVVLHGTISGAKAVLVHKNEMGSSFRVTRVQYALDGAPIFNRVDSGQGELDAQHEIEVFSGSIAPGNHIISTFLEYQGYGYGVFSYLKDYRFKIKSSYTFNAEEGKQTTVKIVGFEKGGFTTELKDRPSVRYDVEIAQVLKPSADVQTTVPPR